jgi:hypothetical protein
MSRGYGYHYGPCPGPGGGEGGRGGGRGALAALVAVIVLAFAAAPEVGRVATDMLELALAVLAVSLVAAGVVVALVVRSRRLERRETLAVLEARQATRIAAARIVPVRSGRRYRRTIGAPRPDVPALSRDDVPAYPRIDATPRVVTGDIVPAPRSPRTDRRL